MADKFPKPTTTTVKEDNGLMVYVDPDKMGIGARASGLPKEASEGPKSLEHVGGSTGGSKK